MKKLTDSYIISKILLNEIFNTIFSSPILNKKRNRYALLCLIIAAYLSYFIFNMSQFNQMFVLEDEITPDMTNILFSSLTNVIIIITGFIYLIVTVSFSLTTKMQHQLKVLPFERDSLLIGSILFQLFLSYATFLIVFAIITPLLKLFYFSFMLNIFIFIYCHLLFFTSITFYHFFFHTISHRMKLTSYNINIILLVVFLFFYFFIFRFKIDQHMMTSGLDITIRLVGFLNLSALVLIGILSYGIFKLKSDKDTIYMVNDFFLIKRMKHVNYFTVLLLGFLRNRLTLSLIGIVTLIAVLSYLDTRDIMITLTTILYIYPLISFSAIRYFGTTASYRDMNPLFGLSVRYETLATTLLNILINLPLIVIAMILAGDFLQMMYYGLILFESALIMSIIFPKDKSSVNEFAASVLCIILALALFLISSNMIIFAGLFIILVGIKLYLLERSLTVEVI